MEQEEEVGVGVVGGLTAKPCRNGLMGANELGTCHHNAERPLVHLGARVPMQRERERERGMREVGGGGGGGGGGGCTQPIVPAP